MSNPPPDTRCRAIIGTSTREDSHVTRCRRSIVHVADDGTMTVYNPDNLMDGGYWSIWCRQHRVMDLHAQACDSHGTGPGRDPDGNRDVGPERILKHHREKT